MNWLILLCKVTVINLVLSGDNALAISIASSKLPRLLRKKAIIVGSIFAILLLICFIALGTYFIKLPMVKSIAALTLLFIAVKLTKDQFNTLSLETKRQADQASSLYRAIGMILLADLGMSLDNAIAMVGVSNGRISVLMVSLLISIPILVVASHFIASLMKKVPWLVYFASGYISWIAANMFAEDPLWGKGTFESRLHWAVPAAFMSIFIITLMFFILRSRHKNDRPIENQFESLESMDEYKHG